MTSSFTQAGSKRQKATPRDVKVNCDADFFQGVGPVEYRPDAGPEDTLCYRHYNASERIHGRTMEDWLRPSIAFHQAFRRPDRDGVSGGDDASPAPESCRRRLRAAFELLSKLGVKHWTLYDTDIAGVDGSVDDGPANELVELILELQQRTGVKPLWVAADLHSHDRYVNGSGSSPDAAVYWAAGAQLKRCTDLAHRLGAEGLLHDGRRDGYATPLNTDVNREMHNYGKQLKMLAGYRERLGYRGQLLFKADSQHGQDDAATPRWGYAPDAASAMCLLKHYSLERHFKLSVAAGHQLLLTSAYGMLGSIDLTTTATPPNVRDATLLMKTVIEQGGMQPGGLNMGGHLVRELTDVKEMAVAYISCIDMYARGFRNAAKLVTDGVFAKNLQLRYLSYHTGFGSRLANGEASLEDCEDQTRKQRVEAAPTCGRTRHWEAVFDRYL